MSDLLYCTDSVRFGKNDWRIEVRIIDGSKCPVPMFRRVGDNGPWRYPADFTGAMPGGLVNFVLQRAIPIARALS